MPGAPATNLRSRGPWQLLRVKGVRDAPWTLICDEVLVLQVPVPTYRLDRNHHPRFQDVSGSLDEHWILLVKPNPDAMPADRRAGLPPMSFEHLADRAMDIAAPRAWAKQSHRLAIHLEVRRIHSLGGLRWTA